MQIKVLHINLIFYDIAQRKIFDDHNMLQKCLFNFSFIIIFIAFKTNLLTITISH